MTQKIYTLFLTALFLFTIQFAVSQTTDTKSSDWKLYSTLNGVEIYVKLSIYQSPDQKIHQQVYLIKLKNTTKSVVTVSGLKELWFGLNCRSCNLSSPNEYEFMVKLNPNQTISGKTEPGDNVLRIFVKDLNYPENQLPRLELSNLKTEFK